LLALQYVSQILREASEGGGWITQSLYADFSSKKITIEQWLVKIKSIAQSSPTLEEFACAVSLSLVEN